ncbi:MAG: hypothetical protein L0241_02855 [Planctomycetia bacterium]|nr:hypothetical protein [Planctomycetia bacterium]
MSEEAWQTEQNARELLKFLPTDLSERKLRLFVVAVVCAELNPPVGSEAESALQFAERIADDRQNINVGDWVNLCEWLAEDRRMQPGPAKANARFLEDAISPNVSWAAPRFLESVGDSGNGRTLVLLREVFGNPFRPVDFAAWRTDTALSLARQMYESREFSTMPILADALQDAGCDNDDVLSHCRDAKQVHVRGCWVVDGVLGKE